MGVTSNSILMMLSIILTMISSYAALDLFYLLNSSEHKKRLLFIGGTFSMGIGIGMMNFFGILLRNMNSSLAFHFPIVLLSMILGILFTGMAFYTITRKSLKASNVFLASFFMTLAVFLSYVMGMYSMNLNIHYDKLLMVLSILLLFGVFLFSFWMLFYTKSLSQTNQVWLKPVGALIITATIVEGHFLFIRSSLFEINKQVWSSPTTSETFIMYVILLVSIIILGGLISISVLISKQLTATDTNLKDITAALNEHSIVAITNPKGQITFVNEKFIEISKYSEFELIGEDHRILNSGFHSKEFFKELWATIGSGEVWKGDIQNRAKDGTLYWVNTTIVPFLDKKGKPYQYVSIRTDITARKQIEVNLKNSLKELSDIKFALDQSSIIVFTDEKGRITNVNERFCQISKYDRRELIGQDHRILNSGYHTPRFFKELWHTIGQGKVWKGEIRNKAKDGHYYWVDTTIIPFINEMGKPYQYLAIRNDITERKKTENILHRQDKLAAIGQLAAGIAHEIRNPLTSIKGYAEFLQLDEKHPERLEFLDIILDEIERVNAIVEEFMVLAKPKEANLSEKNIIPIIKEVLSLLEFEARKKHVRLHFEWCNEIIQVECDEDRLKQVFLNLVKNGIEAMPNGGDLRVFTKIHEDQVEISFQDTGIGIPEEKLKKIGEPFYTTKENGNGLGLMVSFKIIESHKGNIYIESEVDKGTTFNIILPVQTA
ncbi:PAS domain-containing protein [Bacillus sp. V3B]|uniref:PAS domain-containing protein n=1 Tax=Bacillus sp. V3B TaxID=2804915 RepID=UPI00210C1C95|nr:PAS domain-containing protein [Bacillus sp. V3B]MCQ6276822.1 PAS domain-containing protein [Bacillus sp. V3B]